MIFIISKIIRNHQTHKNTMKHCFCCILSEAWVITVRSWSTAFNSVSWAYDLFAWSRKGMSDLQLESQLVSLFLLSLDRLILVVLVKMDRGWCMFLLRATLSLQICLPKRSHQKVWLLSDLPPMSRSDVPRMSRTAITEGLRHKNCKDLFPYI